MASGYTYGIIDGSISTFEQFAIRCTRAFLYHMRDEPANAEYKEKEPSEYYKELGKEARKELSEILELTEQEIMDRETKNIQESIKSYSESLKKKREQELVLKEFLQKAKEYSPPTKEHKGIAEFMVKQLEETIRFDCDHSYYEKSITDLEESLKTINVVLLREELIRAKENQIVLCRKSYEEEVESVERHNKWYKEFINSLKD